MNETTILLWIAIFIIGAVAIFLVKKHFKADEIKKDDTSNLQTNEISNLFGNNQRPLENDNIIQESPSQQEIFSQSDENYITYDYPEVEVENNNSNTFEYSSQNQVLINYEKEVKKFQEPMKEYQVEIMSPDNNEKTELKDLFTIDELIKESKRKDSEREKESQQIRKDDDKDLEALKESIRQRKENEQKEDKLIEEILADEDEELLNSDEPVEETPVASETINDILTNDENKVEETQSEEVKEIIKEEITSPETSEEVETPDEESVQEISNVETDKNEIPSVASQKEIEEAINTASQEIEEKEVESISDEENITDVLLNSEQEITEEIKKPTLKSPTKIEDNVDTTSEMSNSIEEEEIDNELDYRKDLAKITNTIKGSKLFQDVKERFTSEPEEVEPISDLEENYIRNVNEYEDEYAPIINETHDDYIEGFGDTYEPEYDTITPETSYNQTIREENTRRLFDNNIPKQETITQKPKIDAIKPKPARDNIKIQLNNSEVVLKKGDEIIFKHDGETYSSQVYAINGDDISVKYRRKNITIKPEDVKKIY